jgi:hypothetical protein
MNLEQRGGQSRCKCGGWSNDCDTNNFTDHIVVNPYPRDDRCGCPVCPTCRYQKPCELCTGSCPVCIGLINPGPIDLNRSYVIKSSIVEDTKFLRKAFDACKRGDVNEVAESILSMYNF